MYFWRNDHVKFYKQFHWFRKWVLERQIYRTLSRDKKQSARSIQRLFKTYLLAAPEFPIRSQKQAHLIIDGTYFNNNMCLVLYHDHDIKYIQLHRLTDRERYEEVKEDLENLAKLGVEFESITCDGHRALLKAIRKTYPDVLVQRCLFHIQRMSRVWLTSKPQSECAQQLLMLTQQLMKLDTKEKVYQWMVNVHHWEEHFKDFIGEKSINPFTLRTWYKHKMIRRVRTLLKRAWLDMFHYIYNNQIPKTTNALEGYFSHLKNHLNVNRGLTLQHRIGFIKWYLYFNNGM
jgi:hypothetical protein